MSETEYLAFIDDEELDEHEDELVINWPILLTRIFVLFLITCCLVSLGLGGLDERFFYLASIILGASIVILVLTFFECFQNNLCITTHGRDTKQSQSDIDQKTEKEDEALEDTDTLVGDRLISIEDSTIGRTLSFSELEDSLIINWPILCTRIFVLFLIICCIVSLGLGGGIHDDRYFILASIILAASLLLLILTFFDCFQRNLCTTIHAHGKETRTLDEHDLSHSGGKSKTGISLKKTGARVPLIV